MNDTQPDDTYLDKGKEQGIYKYKRIVCDTNVTTNCVTEINYDELLSNYDTYKPTVTLTTLTGFIDQFHILHKTVLSTLNETKPSGLSYLNLCNMKLFLGIYKQYQTITGGR